MRFDGCGIPITYWLHLQFYMFIVQKKDSHNLWKTLPFPWIFSINITCGVALLFRVLLITFFFCLWPPLLEISPYFLSLWHLYKKYEKSMGQEAMDTNANIDRNSNPHSRFLFLLERFLLITSLHILTVMSGNLFKDTDIKTWWGGSDPPQYILNKGIRFDWSWTLKGELLTKLFCSFG